jgi:hypothetical protein
MESGKCIRCDQPATRQVVTKQGATFELCDWCADQWDEDYADDSEETSKAGPTSLL